MFFLGPALGNITPGISYTTFIQAFLYLQRHKSCKQCVCSILKLFPSRSYYCTLLSKCKTFLKYKNFFVFFIIFTSSIASPSFSALLVEAKDFLQTKSIALPRYFCVTKHFLCTQLGSFHCLSSFTSTNSLPLFLHICFQTFLSDSFFPSCLYSFYFLLAISK